ncbi:MAG: hypothetical protein U0Y68_11370 [Blastocatellia bacterium]
MKIGGAFRQGALDKNGKEAVGGVVVARYGVDTLNVINSVKQKDRRTEKRPARRRRSCRFTTALN